MLIEVLLEYDTYHRRNNTHIDFLFADLENEHNNSHYNQSLLLSTFIPIYQVFGHLSPKCCL